MGIASGDWPAAHVLNEMIQILIQEVFGYHTVVQGLSVREMKTITGVVAVLSHNIAWIAGRGQQCLKQPNHVPLEGRRGGYVGTFNHPCRTTSRDSGPLCAAGVRRLHPTLRGERHLRPCFHGLFASGALGKGHLTQLFPRVGTWCFFH